MISCLSESKHINDGKKRNKETNKKQIKTNKPKLTLFFNIMYDECI